jgi:hypothetical protein
MVASKRLSVLTAWQPVTTPPGWSWSLPFTIERLGRRFRPRAFSISKLAATGKAYYVKKGGNDGDTGLDWDHAFANLWYAIGLSDCVEIHIGEGRYGFNEANSIPGAYAQTLIGYGDVILSTELFLTSWSSYGSHSFQHAFTVTVGSVWDGATLDAYGDFTQYTLAANAAAVDATPGSYYLDDPGNVLYVRCLDDRQPDTDVHVYRGSSNCFNTGYLKSYYLENLTFEGGSNRSVRFYDAAGTGGMNVYMKNVSIKYTTPSNYNALQLDSCELSILQDVTVAKSLKDGINYGKLSAIVPKGIEIDCQVRNCGAAGDNTMNCSTSHQGSTIVRIGGNYHRSYGPVIADVNTAVVWNLGVEAHHNLNSGGGTCSFYIDGSAWLDRCFSHDPNPYDLFVEAAGDALYHRLINSTGNNYNGGGTLTTY